MMKWDTRYLFNHGVITPVIIWDIVEGSSDNMFNAYSKKDNFMFVVKWEDIYTLERVKETAKEYYEKKIEEIDNL